VFVDGAQNVVEFLVRIGFDLDPRMTRIKLTFAEFDLLDRVGSAAREDFVENLGQEQGIDDVALQLDLFDERFCSWAWRLLHALIVPIPPIQGLNRDCPFQKREAPLD